MKGEKGVPGIAGPRVRVLGYHLSTIITLISMIFILKFIVNFLCGCYTFNR